jgi:8-oxo-dGTP pyrophosphatase MutT (NUDIX family)
VLGRDPRPRRGVRLPRRQPREAVEEDALLEIPAGTRDHEGETELECARRELAEEAELAATDWTELTKIYPSSMRRCREFATPRR